MLHNFELRRYSHKPVRYIYSFIIEKSILVLFKCNVIITAKRSRYIIIKIKSISSSKATLPKVLSSNLKWSLPG